MRSGTKADLFYCRSLRNRYVHRRGQGQQIPHRDQLSDLTIIERVVKALTNSHESATDRELLDEIGRYVHELVEVVALSVAPERFDSEPSVARTSLRFEQAAINDIAEQVAIRLEVKRDPAASLHGTSSERPADGAVVIAGLSAAIGRIEPSLADLSALPSELRAFSASTSIGLDRLHRELSAFVETYIANDDALDELDEVEDQTNDGPECGYDEVVSSLIGQEMPGGAAERRIEPQLLTSEQARAELIQLRRRIWDVLGTGPSRDGLLRKSMIDEFLRLRPTTNTEIMTDPLASLLASVDPDERQYLPEVLGILRRMHA
jgi:hypothetical protein